MSKVRGLVNAMRPRQWLKNLLVFAAPGAAGVLTQREAAAQAALAFVVFCLVSSGVYLINDVIDRSADALHPRKKHRSIAAGTIRPRLALTAAFLLLASGLGTSLLLGRSFLMIVSLYVTIMMLYSLWLKAIPVIELATVTSGFVIRGIAGGIAVDVPISQWFLIVASFGSFFVVAGKRRAEHESLVDERGAHRIALDHYPLSFLDHVRWSSASVCLASYCLWAFERAGTSDGTIWFELSIVPFALFIFTYGLQVEQGKGGVPEDLVLHNRLLQTLASLWVICFGLGVYAP